MVSGDKRSPAFPDVPSAKEVGLPDYTVTTWYGIWAPKGTPAAIQTAAIAEIKKAVESPELKVIWANQGAEFSTMNPTQFGSFINSEIKRWANVVKASGAKLD
jgi:tripartite-type tricarboxylate transporter receptor subunit TctC